MKRKAIPSATETEVLIRSRRRCCLCFFWESDLETKDGQIAHLDRNRANNRGDNLAYLCLDHHNEYDRRSFQAKNLGKQELRYARALLYEAMETAEKPRWIASLTFEQNFQSFTSKKENEILNLMQQLFDRRIGIREKRAGSVILTFELKQHETARLFAAIAKGRFAKFRLLAASVEEAPRIGAPASFIQNWQHQAKTVVEVDLVNYSKICASLEESLDVRNVYQLNQQIQSFIDGGLQACCVLREKALITTTGDGAILVFDTAAQAHEFAEVVHTTTREHNQNRSSPLAKRLFRIGIATGDLVMQPRANGGFDIAGVTIARAVRLESRATPGGVMVDASTFNALTAIHRAKYGPQTMALGKRPDERFTAYPCQINPDGPRDSDSLTQMGVVALATEPPVPTNHTQAADQDWLSIPECEWHGSPGSLLRADLGIVPFHGRETEITDFKKWAFKETRSSVRLLTGSGGMGKTRFARELCVALSSEGLQCGFLDLHQAEQCMTFLRKSRDEPMLFVIDYAEIAEAKVAEIIGIAMKRGLVSLRFLLLARGAGFWWSRLKRNGNGVADCLPLQADKLKPLTLNLDARRHSYQLATCAFAERLGVERPLAEPTDLAAHHYERTLLLHMSALLSVQNLHAQGMDPILQSILDREKTYWASQLQYRQLPIFLEPGFERAMGVISAYAGLRDKQEAVHILRNIRFFNGQPQAVIEAVADILHDCYAGAKWIDPVQPDLLMEFLVAKATRDDKTDFDRILLP